VRAGGLVQGSGVQNKRRFVQNGQARGHEKSIETL
jgi:hypothetical protein